MKSFGLCVFATMYLLVTGCSQGAEEDPSREAAPSTEDEVVNGAPESVYTSLDPGECNTADEAEAYSKQECPGFGGYKLFVEDSDLRAVVTIAGPKHESTLDVSTLGGGFSHLGPKAEWRFVKGKTEIPFALVYRHIISWVNDGGRATNRPFLIVAKVTASQSCVTAIIDASKHADANARARAAADATRGRQCPTRAPTVE